MMTYQEFTHQFKLQTEALTFQQQIHLAVSVCRKLFFDYQKFSDDNNWGNPDLIMDTIGYIEQAQHSALDASLLQYKTDQVMAVTPDTEDSGDAGYALNCCVAVCESLGFLSDQKAGHIYNIGTCLIDTIDAKIQDEKELTEKEIDENAEMIAAREYLLGLSQ